MRRHQVAIAATAIAIILNIVRLTGGHEVGGGTLAVLSLGESCGGDPKPGSCDTTAGLECTEGKCDCKSGYTISRNGTKCLEIARNGLESPCEESIQCWKSLLGRLSECHIGTNRCSCYESDTLPIVFHQGRCYYGESLGEYCQIEGLCTATTLHAVCKMGVCQCKEGYVPSWDKSRCLPIATQGLNSPCEENIQCEKSSLGALSECNLERMQCECYQVPEVPMVFHSGRCYFGAGLGQVCQVSPQCTATTLHSSCGSDGKCRCVPGYATEGGNGSECLLQQAIHQLLYPPTPTMLEEVFIPSPLPPNHLTDDLVEESSNTKETVREMDIAPEVEPECLQNSDCMEMYGYFARCRADEGRCECYNPDDVDQTIEFRTTTGNNKTSAGHHHHHEVSHRLKCYNTKYLGQGCKFSAQCDLATKYSKCLDGHCKCEPSTHVASEDRRFCLAIATGLDSSCSEDAQCRKSPLGEVSKCERGKCVCFNDTTVVGKGRCWLARSLDQECSIDEECRKIAGPLAVCHEEERVCRCGGNSVPGKNSTSCVPRPSLSPQPRNVPVVAAGRSGKAGVGAGCFSLVFGAAGVIWWTWLQFGSST